jgi:thymidylate kinase
LSRGLLVALEGGPGAGTAAQALALRRWLDGQGVPAELAAPLGADGWLLEPPVWPPASRVAPFLFRMAEMADTWLQVAAPAVAAGSVVIADRYRLTLMAHARARRLDPGWVGRVASALPAADLTVYVRSDPARQLDRLLRAGASLLGWEAGVDTAHATGWAGAFHAYQALVARQLESLAGPAQAVVVDGDGEPAALERGIHDAVTAALEAAAP